VDYDVDCGNRELWRHYQRDDAHSFSGAHARLNSLRRTAARLQPNRCLTVLNIGIGDGWLERKCQQSGWPTSALDPDEEAVSSLKRHGVDSRCGTMARMPFETGQFDVIFCSEVLEHLRDSEVGTGLSEVARCLRDRGHLIGTVPYREDLRENTVYCPHCKLAFHKWGHFQSFDESRLREIIEPVGFKVLAMHPRAFVEFSRKGIRNLIKGAVRAILGRLGEPIAGPNLFFVAQKSTRP